jgi:hypothetical protein
MAAFLASAAILSAGPALGAPSAQAKKLAAIASDEGAFKKAQAELRRNAGAQAKSKDGIGEFERLCRIKPVMTDPEIESCRRAYRL